MFRWAWSKTGSLIERVQKWIPCFTKFMFDLLLFFVTICLIFNACFLLQKLS